MVWRESDVPPLEPEPELEPELDFEVVTMPEVSGCAPVVTSDGPSFQWVPLNLNVNNEPIGAPSKSSTRALLIEMEKSASSGVMFPIMVMPAYTVGSESPYPSPELSEQLEAHIRQLFHSSFTFFEV
jgi:hypothetical protein